MNPRYKTSGSNVQISNFIEFKISVSSEATKLVILKVWQENRAIAHFSQCFDLILKMCFIRKNHWAPSEVIEVKRPFLRSQRPNLGFHLVSIYTTFRYWTSIILQPRQPQKGLRDFSFKNYIFEIGAFWSTFSLNP